MHSKATCVWMGCMLLVLSGCKKSMSPSTIMALDNAAAITLERAKAFQVLRPQLTARDESDLDAIHKYLDAHAVALEAHAAGLAKLQDALKRTNGDISDSLRTHIAAAADTALGQHQNWVAAKRLLGAAIMGNESAVEEWIEAHGNALFLQAGAMKTFADSVKGDAGEKDAE